MKTVPVTLLKTATKGIITNFESNMDTDLLKGINRLQAIGFVPPREVQLIKRRGNIVVLQVGSDNSFAVQRTLADRIMVEADEGDIFESFNDVKKSESLIEDLKKLFAKFKNKVASFL